MRIPWGPPVDGFHHRSASIATTEMSITVDVVGPEKIHGLLSSLGRLRLCQSSLPRIYGM